MSDQDLQQDEEAEYDAELSDNLTLLTRTLKQQSLARNLVDARTRGSPLIDVVKQRLEELRKAYALPTPQDD